MEYLIVILLELIKFIGLTIGVWMVVEASTPIQIIKESLNIHRDTKTKKRFVEIIAKLFSCSLCLGFWTGLFYYQSVELALVTSLGSELFYRIANKTL